MKGGCRMADKAALVRRRREGLAQSPQNPQRGGWKGGKSSRGKVRRGWKNQRWRVVGRRLKDERYGVVKDVLREARRGK